MKEFRGERFPRVQVREILLLAGRARAKAKKAGLRFLFIFLFCFIVLEASVDLARKVKPNTFKFKNYKLELPKDFPKLN